MQADCIKHKEQTDAILAQLQREVLSLQQELAKVGSNAATVATQIKATKESIDEVGARPPAGAASSRGSEPATAWALIGKLGMLLLFFARAKQLRTGAGVPDVRICRLGDAESKV